MIVRLCYVYALINSIQSNLFPFVGDIYITNWNEESVFKSLSLTKCNFFLQSAYAYVWLYLTIVIVLGWYSAPLLELVRYSTSVFLILF